MTELGAGFRLAMRDLEIRGSGNLLGAAQHGHIAAVGFDLYSKLLGEAVRELKGEPAGRARGPRDLGRRGGAPARDATCPRSTSASPSTSGWPRSSARTRWSPCGPSWPIASAPRRPPWRRCSTWWRCASWPRRLGVERIEARGGRAVFTFAPSTSVTPERILNVIAQESRCHGAQEGIHTGSARARGTVAGRSRRPPRRARVASVMRGRRRLPARSPAAARRRARGLLHSVVGPPDRQGQAAPPPAVAAPPAPPPRLTAAAQRLPDSQAVMDRVICVVNNDAITLYELDEAEAHYLYETKQTSISDDEAAAAPRPAAPDDHREPDPAPGGGAREDHRRGLGDPGAAQRDHEEGQRPLRRRSSTRC